MLAGSSVRSVNQEAWFLHMGLSMGCLDFLTVWWLSSKCRCPQRELGRSYITIYDLGLEVNITLFSPVFKRREYIPHFSMGSVSKSHCKKSSWDGIYCYGHLRKYNQLYTWLVHSRGIWDQVGSQSIIWTNKMWITTLSPSKWVSILL